MCTVSMVLDSITTPHNPNYMKWTRQYPTPDVALQLIEVIQRLDKIDKQLGLLDCKIEARAKKQFMKKLERRAAKKGAS